MRVLLALTTALVAIQAGAASLNINASAGPIIDGDGSCTLDASQNNNQICTNDIARYRVQYQAIGPAPSTNLTITAGPLPADFRWSRNGPGMGSCVNAASTRISPDGKSLTCVVAASGLVSGTLDFDVTTDSTAQNGSGTVPGGPSPFASVTWNINNVENSPAISGGQKTDTSTGVTVIAQPRIDAFKLLHYYDYGVVRPTASTYAMSALPAATQTSSGAPTFCGGNPGDLGVSVNFYVGGNATQLKGHERLGNTFSFTDDLSGFPVGSCIWEIRPLNSVVALPAAINAGATPSFTGSWSWTQTTATSATITVTGADTSGTFPFPVGANVNTVIAGWARIWVPVAAIQAAGGSVAGKNMLRNFDPTSVSGVSNFGGPAGVPPACPVAVPSEVEPDYCATNITPANVTNQAAWGPIVLGRGDFGKYYQQTSETFATTQQSAGDYPYLTNDWIGPGDKVDSFTLMGNSGALPVTGSLCDKWDNRKLRLITVDPATVRTHAGTGPNYAPTGNAAYHAGPNNTLTSAVGYAHSYPYNGSTFPPGNDYEFGRVGGAAFTDDTLSAAGCEDSDSILGTLGVGPTTAWITHAQLKANPSWAQYINAVRFRDITLPPGIYASINPHLQVLAGNPFGSPTAWPIGTIIPNFGSVKWTGSNQPNNYPNPGSWYNPYYHPGTDSQAVFTSACPAAPIPDAAYCGAENPGRRLRLTTMEPKIRKGIASVDPIDGPLVAPTAEPTGLGRTHRFQLWPTLNVYAPAAPITGDVVVVDTLPNGLLYLGNATLGGTPVTPAAVVANSPAAGQTTVVWLIPNQIATGLQQVKLPVIEFDAQVDLDNPVNAPNSVLINVTEVRACSPGATVASATGAITCVDFNPLQPLAERTSDRSLILGTSGALIAVKTVTPAVDQILTPFQMTVRYKNAGSTPVSENRAIDKLPYNNDLRGDPSPVNDQSRFSGTRPLSQVTVGGTTGYTVFYSTAPVASIDDDPKCPSNLAAPVGAWAGVVGAGSGCLGGAPGWLPATQVGATAVWNGFPAGTTAILIRDANAMAPSDPSRPFTMDFTTAANRHGDRYSNNAFVSNTTVEFYQLTNDVTTRKVAASIQGTVFVDPNLNAGTAGFLPAEDTGLGGVTVTLRKGASVFGTAITATAAIAPGQYYNPATGAGTATYGPGVCPVPAAGLAIGQYLFCDLLAANDYSVVETQPAGYVTTGDKAGNGATPGTVTTPTDTISAIALTVGQAAVGYDFGEIALRTISVTKAVTLPATPPPSPTYTNSFNFSIACTANNGLTPTPANGTAASFAVVPGTPVNVNNVVDGASCTVTELGPLPTLTPAAFSWNAIPAPIVQTVGASTPAFAFTNVITRSARDISITKQVTGAPVGFSATYAFSLACGSESPTPATFSLTAGNSQTVTNVSVGASCTLTETTRPAAPAGYRWAASSPLSATFTVTNAPDPNVVTFTNVMEPDTRPVTVTKVIAGATDGTPTAGTYSFTLTACSSGPASYAQQDLTAAQVAASTPLTFPNVQIGATCTLNEIARPAAPNGFAWTTTLPATQSVTIGLAGAPAAQAETFTNTLERRYQLGNRLFFDTSGNGTREAAETSGPVGVTVVLTDSTGAALYRQADGSVSTNTAGTLISTVTDATGLYVFNDLPAGTYAVRVPGNQFAAGGALAGYLSSPDGSGNNADNGVGTSPAAGTSGIAGGILSTPRTFAAAGAPTAEADGALPAGAPVYPDNQSDTTLDLGFYRLSVTAAVWKDDGNNAATPANINNGVFDSGEVGIQGVRVELYNGSTLVAVTTTGPGGVYTFNQGTDANGVPNGLPLVPGNAYQVRVPQATPTVNTSLISLASSAASGASETTPLGAANDDSGVGTAAASASVTSSANFTLGAGTNAGANSVANNTTGTTNQPNLDFGFAPSYSVGNRVWNDLNNNGILDGAEVGLQGVTVRLLDASGNPVPGVATQTTDANGYYRFDGLPAGNYIVEIAPPAVNGVNYVSSTGTNASATGPYEPGSSSTAAANNNQDHGTQTTPTTIRSGVIAVGPTSLVTGDGDAGATGVGAPGPNGDPFDVATVDFGIFLPAKLGNLVWNDVNKNGTADVGEAGLNGVSVILRDVNGVEITRQVTRNNPTTGAPGYYQFDYLIPGQYRVEFSAPGYFGTVAGTPSITSGSGPDTNNSQIVPGRDLGTTQLVTVAPGDNNPQLDAGYIVPPVEVPTLSELIKLLLAMLMLSVGVIAVRARQR